MGYRCFSQASVHFNRLFHICHWLQSAAALLSTTKDALDSFIFSNGTSSPASIAGTINSDAALLVIPPEATSAIQALDQTQASYISLSLGLGIEG